MNPKNPDGIPMPEPFSIYTEEEESPSYLLDKIFTLRIELANGIKTGAQIATLLKQVAAQLEDTYPGMLSNSIFEWIRDKNNTKDACGEWEVISKD